MFDILRGLFELSVVLLTISGFYAVLQFILLVRVQRERDKQYEDSLSVWYNHLHGNTPDRDEAANG